MAFETEFALLTNHLQVIEDILNAAKEHCDFATEIKAIEVRIQNIKNKLQGIENTQCSQEVSLIKIARDLRKKTS